MLYRFWAGGVCFRAKMGFPAMLVVLLLWVAGVKGISDPCSPGAHTELNEKERSTGYKNEYPAKPLCDITLQPGWYRFTSLAGGTIPESCPGILQCGTVVPVWMNGQHPSVADDIVTRQACANFHTGSTTATRSCCEHSISIGVKNCGDFYVYYLRPTPSCPISYCAGDKAPCPVGMWSPSGFPPCKDAYPKISTDPTLTGPEVVGHTFHFSCHINYTRHDPDLAFDVLWTFDGKPDASIPVQTLRDPAREATLDGELLKGHMGTNVGCQIRARYMTHVNMSSPWLKSSTYWAGIRSEQTHLTVSEKEETKNVTFVSTIPVLCDHQSVCCLTMKVDVDGPKENLVSAHACEYEICSDDWDPTSKEARIDVPVTASKDQIKDGNKDLMLAFENILSSGGGPYLRTFDGYRPQNVPVDAQDVTTKSCSWVADPHIHPMTYPGTFNLLHIGDYTMIENPQRDMEIQARTWPCGTGRVTCVCGITIREKDDVIRINECDQPYRGHHTSPTVETASHLREGTVVQRSTDGNHITVYLPSGMEVKVDARSTSLNAYITVPSIDSGKARGICGTFDNITGNDFTRRDGVTERECSNCQPDRFTESWKNTPQTSLFETLPPKTHEDSVPKYCSCDKDELGKARINCTVRGDIPRHTLKCTDCSTLHSPLPSFLDPQQGWSRRSEVHVDRDERDPKFDMEQYKDFQPANNASWPTPSGITESQAETKCRHALQTCQLWNHCQQFPALYQTNLIDCVTDVLYGDSYDMVELALAAFLTECQTTLSRDPANYVSNAQGKSVLKPEFSSDVCSVFCFRHGTCVHGKCRCHQGYAGDNCHLIAGKGPQLARIRSNNTCDINKRPCRKIFLDASNIEHKPSLACKAQVLEEDGSVAPRSHVEEAVFLSAGRMACFLPDTKGKAVTRFHVSATNDGQLYDNTLNVTVYDSTCLSCDQNGTCALLDSTCNINNMCHQDGDVKSDDVTQVCNSKVSTSSWTTRPTQPSGNYPNITTPIVTGPDDDVQMVCAVNTSATESSARFKVTWYIDNEPRETLTLTKEQLPAYLNLFEIHNTGQVSCKVRSFFAGQTDFSPLLTSNEAKLAGTQQ